MKPSFALSLSHDGIRLFSRAKGGWRLVGESSLDAPDLTETLAYLRDKATRLSRSGLSTKLILPSSQILYTSVTAPGPDDAARSDQIRSALTGITPYAADELNFDWRVTDDLVNVAAVAIETLQEAEAFAVEHRFNPVSFVGESLETSFEGEPFFGATQFSKSFLDDGEIVEADSEAFVITDKKKGKIFSGSLDRTVLLAPSAKEAPKQPKPDETPVAEELIEVSKDEIRVEEKSTETAEAEDENLSEPQEADTHPPEEDDLDSPTSSDGTKKVDDDKDLADFFSSIQAKNPSVEVVTPEIPELLQKAKGTTSVPSQIIGTNKPLTANRNSSDGEASFVHRPVASGTPPAELAARLNASAKISTKADGPKSGIGITGAAIGFASSLRKKKASDTGDATEFSTSREPEEPNEALDALNIVSGGNAEVPTELQSAPPTPIISESADSVDSRSAEERLASANITSAALELPDSEEMSASLGLEALRAGATDYKPSLPIKPDEDVTVFGAPKSSKRNAKPRNMGFILLLGLVVVMGLVALWSLFSAPSEQVEQTSPSGTFQSFNEDLEASLPTAAAPPDVETQDVVLASAPVALDNVPVIPETTAPAQPVLASLSDSTQTEFDDELQIADQSVDISEPESPEPLTASQALEAYDDSGIWQFAPDLETSPAIITTDSLYVPSLDPPLDISDAVALPIALDTPDDRPLPQQPSPAPAGSTFALGENGLVVPSTQGVINPDGVLVFAGPPVKRSTPRPDSGGVGRSSDPSLPELVARRPSPRPSNLIQLNEIAKLGGRTRDQLASLRPTARPISEQIAAQTSSDGQALSTTATALAVKASRVPATRPANFASLVEKARKIPVNIEKKAASQQQVAKVTSTRATATGPKIPTRASVATEATQKNKIHMRKVSLIGIYGTPQKRSALVRMGNGKIIEVSIGDRVDGGKVAAIGADQVRYVKGGRNILLKMPPRG